MENKSWRDFIPTYLRDFYSQFNFYTNDKVHALVVEGPTDEDFYWRLFDKAYFFKNNKKIVFNTPKKKIISNFSNNFENLFLRSEPYKLKLKQHKKEFDMSDKSDYRGYLFVTECISYYENNRQFFKFLDCYGMIDNDFGHSELTEGLTNISATKFHDRETCILRCYLPELINQVTKKEEAVSLLTKIIDTSFKQGIIEELSHKYEEEVGKDKFLRQLTNYYFKGNCKTTDLRMGSFDFDDYLNNYENYITLDINPSFINAHKSKYQRFVDEAKNRIRTIYTFEDELFNLLHRWLLENNTNDIDEKRIDRIFKYCNAHILLNQMIMFGKDIFNVTKENDFINQIVEKIIFGKNMYSTIFNTLPLKLYKKYREDNNFYTFL